MPETELLCPKYQAELEEGFVADSTYGGTVTSKWIEGEPEISFWTGLKMRGKEQVEIRTFRCSRCDYLESYAK